MTFKVVSATINTVEEDPIPQEDITMAKKFDLYETLKANGFYEVHDEFGDVLRKDYEKQVEVLWYGIQTSYFIARIRFNADHSVVQASYYDDKIPARAFKTKTHLNEKRAFNAIKATVENNGYEF